MTKKFIYILLFAMLIALSSSSESFKISGKVVDEDNKALKGTTIKVDGTTKGCIVKDKDGKFEITIPGNSAIIKVSYIGKLTQNISVTKDSVNMIIVMKSNPVESKELSVVADKMIREESVGSTMMMRVSKALIWAI
jgi:hypothetical protein